MPTQSGLILHINGISEAFSAQVGMLHKSLPQVDLVYTIYIYIYVFEHKCPYMFVMHTSGNTITLPVEMLKKIAKVTHRVETFVAKHTFVALQLYMFYCFRFCFCSFFFSRGCWSS